MTAGWSLRGGGRRPLVLVELGLVALMAGAVGFSFGRVFGGAELGGLVLWPALGAVVLVGVVTGEGRWSPSSSLLASLGVGLVVVTVVSWRTFPAPSDLWGAVEAIVAVRRRVLSAPLPAPDRPELLVVVAACTWLVAYAGAELVLRVRSPLVPLVPFVVAAVVPSVLGAGGRPPSGWVLGALTLGAVALVLLRAAGLRDPVDGRRHAQGGGADGPRHARGRRDGAEAGAATTTRGAERLRRRRLVAALPVVVVAGVLPVALRDHLPLSREEPRFDPRAEARGSPPDLFNPLVEVSAQRSAPQDEELFVASAPEGVELWRLAVLDSFDGATWRSSGTFAPAGTELPQSVGWRDGAGSGDTESAGAGAGSPGGSGDEEGGGAAGARVHQEITIRGLDSPFLPVAGRAVELEGPQVRFDPAGGVVLAEEPPDEGTTYRVASVVVDPGDVQLDGARRDRRGSDAVAARRAVPEAGVLAQVAIDQVTARSAGLTGSADIRQLRALQDFFADQSRFRLATEPRSGLSLRQLTELVRAAVEGGPSEGSIEQFAAAFAVMARTLGYPTRVVAGYRTVEADADGRYHVDNHDAFAWTEVKLEGFGWVPFVAAPIRSDESPPPTEAPTSTTSTTLADEGAPTPTTQAPRGGSAARRRSGGAGTPWWLVGLLLAAGLAVLAAVVAPVLRWQRRWRRARRPDVVGRIDGAWRELLDRLAAQQVPVTGAMTATEVMDVAGAHLGARLPLDAYELAALTNLARFGPATQPPAAATAAWRYADRVVTWARHRLSRRQRLRAWLDPRTIRTIAP